MEFYKKIRKAKYKRSKNRFVSMKYLPFLLFLFANNIFAQKAFFSRVIDQKTNQGLPAATILNKKSNVVTISNDAGDFMIWASRGDTIEITSIGYKTAKFACMFRDTTVRMKEDAQALKAIVVKAKRDEHLKEEIAQFLKDPDAATAMKKQIMRRMIDVRPSSTGTPGLAISVDALWDMFSKEGKMKRKLAELEQKDYKEYLVKERFNAQFVKNITHLEDSEIELFMSFCHFSDDFILRANDYDLTYAILRYKKIFKGE